jgi:hypothetical protein
MSKPTEIHLELTAPFLIAFVALRYVLHEVHEFGHMVVAWLYCGAWGTRDFNNVHPVAQGCNETRIHASLDAMAGPITNYVVLWLGALLLYRLRGEGRAAAARLSWGLALVFASLPFARLFTALVGGGDEFGMARAWLDNPLAARLLTIALIVAVLAWPLWQAFRTLRACGRPWWFFAACLLLPMLVEGALVQGVLNRLLAMGVGSQPGAMGAPEGVLWVLLAALLLFAATAPRIATLARPGPPTTAA